ncbi:SDR family oxidoreductase [Vibrio natriegens]|uniref:NAD(P)-dependent oxidoreductase n=1 Tax=Vibrio natriegens NBRC 15636 = ATCC 14048 = DSM 759 TaxID=1219067 RepID=A0AAN1CXW8_VIBNA|nr:SDR family oxidoreductase [Vibrio natriegens]ALR18247.1 quinone oxidoreductase [Vibrio natriegens NBRC 15636 = ATCC 14048 = DSM 759]ANQ14195.1 NAD(P)-dependent oxidoreductase [Vibrio natriegens NBRC 15636 = ATCC 14048 = DSM 759]EPM40232.1 quinone oxidoreductase [Vibrio natriegens NBRC 15636 = ATCC 14048 = DSM 759]MDX6028866.1 SDR family oxidoreductase [Vibrio natriegens NBRC 15636 = ATCC 14048 = DSM 759]WRS50774.1 SDR family oxidoreductase [Vibrio natriegens NBRC 15636 = ATCC 14048 = DSM 75
MIAVTGATGQLGQLVIKHLLNKVEPQQIVALVRNIEKAASLTSLGVQVRQADYSKPETLESALDGVAKLLLISSSEVGQRATQHKNVIDAAKKAGVELLAYTSLLHADTSPLALAEEHVVTEAYLKQAEVPHVLLRNGWYTENYLASVAPALANGGFIGCAQDGKISSAAREDYAEAAAAVLTSEAEQNGKVYELSGDEAYTLSELSALISKKSGKAIPYINMEEADFAKALEGAGLPAPFAAVLANSDTGASQGALYDDSKTLSALIGHPTKSLEQLISDYI